MTKYRKYIDWHQVPLTFDISVASVIFGKHPGTIKRWASDKTIPAVKIGGEWVFSKTKIQELLNGKQNI